jgi:hypothetical protein
MVEVRVPYIDGLQVAAVQRNPIREGFGLSHVVIASTSTASFSPKIKVDVIGAKPSASPQGFGRSPTIAFPGAVKTLTLSLLDATGASWAAAIVMAAAPRSDDRCVHDYG